MEETSLLIENDFKHTFKTKKKKKETQRICKGCNPRLSKRNRNS